MTETEKGNMGYEEIRQGRDRLAWRQIAKEGKGHGRLSALLAQLAEATSRQSAPLQVRRRLLTEVRLRAVESGGKIGMRSGIRLEQLAFGVAALLTLSVAAWSIFAPGSSRLSSRFLANVYGTKHVANRLVPVTSESAENDAQGAANDDAPQTASSDYYSLPYSDPAISNGTETTVLVSVPSSQLMAWGVPAVGHGADEDVPVNLVLGDDGLPRAIQVLPATASMSTTNEELYP